MNTYAGQAAVKTGSLQTKILASTFFALVVAACSQIAVYLPISPVPVTMQVLAVLLSGLVLGSRWGAICQAEYLVMGAMGLPVFAGFSGGPAAFADPSGGYLFGFVLGAFLAGWVFEKLQSKTHFAAWAAGVAGIAGIYIVGAPWVGIWIGAASGGSLKSTLHGAWFAGVAPFLGIDLIKAFAASGIALGGRFGCGLAANFRRLF
jgi:biotin transport system substrate-specific component